MQNVGSSERQAQDVVFGKLRLEKERRENDMNEALESCHESRLN